MRKNLALVDQNPHPSMKFGKKTQDSTSLTLDVECSDEFDIEQGDEGADAGVKLRVKQLIDELVEQTERDAYDLANALHAQIMAGEVEVETEGRKIIVRIREKGSFRSGSAEMKPEYREVMSEIRSVLALKPGRILVQGHTDNIPINTSRFRSNWELSAARAVSVAHELMKGGNLASSRFEVSGKADTQPLVSNSSSENRARNRRVEIVIRQSLGDEISEEDKDLLKTEEGDDILRELDIAPEYLFELTPEEIF